MKIGLCSMTKKKKKLTFACMGNHSFPICGMLFVLWQILDELWKYTWSLWVVTLFDDKKDWHSHAWEIILFQSVECYLSCDWNWMIWGSTHGHYECLFCSTTKKYSHSHAWGIILFQSMEKEWSMVKKEWSMERELSYDGIELSGKGDTQMIYFIFYISKNEYVLNGTFKY